ncbi:MAG: MFS transporter [Pseudomonadota bacterium]
MSEAGAARSTRSVVAVLGTTQTIAWASSYYLPAVLADPIARDIGVSPGLVFAAFSLALLVSGVLGPLVGRMIDRRGGRDVLCVSNLILAAGLLLLSMATGPVLLFAGWLLIGVGIAAGLYDAAFATLVGIYRERSRTAITGITLIAGFASTIGWPLTALIEDAHGWRMACVCWALVHLFVCLPANRWLLPPPSPAVPPESHSESHPAPAGDAACSVAAPDSVAAATLVQRQRRNTVLLLGFVFAASAFVAGAMATQMIRLLEAMGSTPAAAIFAGMLIGPAQVLARVVELALARHVTPLTSARVALSLHPAGALALVAVGAPAAVPFALLHGATNGLVTIARGTLPLWLFGPDGYGALIGRIGGFARIAQAIAPFAFGLAVDALGGAAVLITGGLMTAAVLALLLIRRPSAP